MRKWDLLLLCASVVALATVTAASEDEDEDGDFEDGQTEFLLPYSETEDVDFTIARPMGSGCYQWSTNNTAAIRLDPVLTDYTKVCGSKLEFQILAGKANSQGDTIQIVAENVEVEGAYDAESDAPATVEYLLHIRPVGSLEVLGLKTSLTAGSAPVPFGVAGYDADDNEFDTLDGLQINWYVGGKREIALFERHRQVGPIVKLLPIRAGKGGVMAVLTDPNYENIDPAILEIEVSAPLTLVPDGPYLLEGGTAQFKINEKTVDTEGKETVSDVPFGDGADYVLELKDSEVATLDKQTGVVTAVKEGETTILVKNTDGDVVRSSPVRVTSASSLKVVNRADPESKQLVLGYEYDIDIVVKDADEKVVHPSPNILCKTTFPKQFDIVEISENGLTARVRATAVGLGKIKASLRSVLTEDDEELEIVPHVKGSTDFEVYESIVIKPRETILPWDKDANTSYDLKYTASGGGKVYQYETDNEELATANNDGTVVTHSGPGVFTIKASNVRGSATNYDEAKVYLLPVTHLSIKEGLHLETSTTVPLTIALVMKTFLREEDEEPVMFTDCADVPYKITLSDNKNFEVGDVYKRGHNRIHESCASFTVKAKTAGTTCKVTVTYVEPTTGRTLKDSVHVTAYRALDIEYPEASRGSGQARSVLLPVGGSSLVVFRGGAAPWHGKPSAHYKQVDISRPSVARATKLSDSETGAPVLSGSYVDTHAYRVTCTKVGDATLTFAVGNTKSVSNTNPVTSVREVKVYCDIPTKVVIKAEPRKVPEDPIKYFGNPKTGNIMAHNYRDVLLDIVVKNAAGRTFSNITSLKFDFKSSDEKLLSETHPGKMEFTTTKLGQDYGKLEVPNRAFKSFSPLSGKKGVTVELTATLVGYDQNVLKEEGIKEDPPAIPRVPDDDEDDFDEEDVETFNAHAHALRQSLDLELASDAEINAARRTFNAGKA